MQVKYHLQYTVHHYISFSFWIIGETLRKLVAPGQQNCNRSNNIIQVETYSN